MPSALNVLKTTGCLKRSSTRRVMATVCPAVLFPYARESVADATMRAGFPPVQLAPINFEALYQQQLAQMPSAAPAPAAVQ